MNRIYEKVNTETVMDDYKNNEILSYLNDVRIERDGTAHVILMWWDLQMDKDGKIVLSMAPKWMDQEKAKRNEVFTTMISFVLYSYSILNSSCKVMLL